MFHLAITRRHLLQSGALAAVAPALGAATGLPSGEKVIGPYTYIGANVIGTIIDLAIESGDNAISVPTPLTCCSWDTSG